MKMVKSVKLVWACRVGLCTPNENDENSKNGLGLCLGWDVGCVFIVRMLKIVKIVWACVWGVSYVPSVKIGKMVWVRDWVVGCVP